jgi:hypothetical protein
MVTSSKKRPEEGTSSDSPGQLLTSPDLESMPDIPPEGMAGEEGDLEGGDESMDPDVLTAQVESHIISKENPLHGTDPGEFKLVPLMELYTFTTLLKK